MGKNKSQPILPKKKSNSNATRKRRKVTNNSEKPNASEGTKEDSNDSMSVIADKIECGVNSLPDPSEGTESKIKYVEAPIPKVNPWKKNEISSDKLKETNTINATISPKLSCENSLLECKFTATNLEGTDIAITDSQSVSSVFQAIGGGNAWRGTADTISKLGPLQDAKPSTMRDTDNWPLLQDMSSAGTSATKARSTPPKEEALANTNHVNKKDSNISNSENSSISGDFVQDIVHDKSDKDYENIETDLPTDLGKTCINDSKEN